MHNRIPDGLLFDPLSLGRRGPGQRDRLSPAQIQQIARTVARTPEVMVKVLSAGASSAAAVKRHLAYVGRQGDVALLTDDGQPLEGREATADLVENWDLDLAESQSGLGGMRGRSAPKLVHKVVFSMVAGTPPDKVLAAVQGFCREEFALKHRFLMALHTDEPHPHVHVVIKAVSEQGERLNIRKATLRAWREGFAQQLRQVGVKANATQRFVRGETRPRQPDPIYRAAERGESTHMRNQLQAAMAARRDPEQLPDPARRQLQQTRRSLEHQWATTIQALESAGQTALAGEARRFVDRLPAARTEAEWLVADRQTNRDTAAREILARKPRQQDLVR